MFVGDTDAENAIHGGAPKEVLDVVSGQEGLGNSNSHYRPEDDEEDSDSKDFYVHEKISKVRVMRQPDQWPTA